MALAKPYRLPGSVEAFPVNPPSPEGNRNPRPPYSEPEWIPGAGQNTLLTKSPTNPWPPAVAPVRPPFRLV